MTAHNNRAPASAGARPSLATLRKLGTYHRLGPEDLKAGDIILYADSAYHVTKKASQRYKGCYITLRELVSNDMKTVRIESHVKIYRLEPTSMVRAHFGGRWNCWSLMQGDVVMYPGQSPAQTVLAIRHTGGWFRTSPPWVPFADAEIVHDVLENRALMVRSGIRRCSDRTDVEFAIGSAVVTRNIGVKDPSVWFRQAEDYWVSNSRGAVVSDQMIRFELGRRTYQVLSLPEVS